jgi:hypothetical protein
MGIVEEAQWGFFVIGANVFSAPPPILEGIRIKLYFAPGAEGWFLPLLRQRDCRPVLRDIIGLELDSPAMVVFTVLGAWVALESDADEMPLAVPPAPEFVEMLPSPAVRAITVGVGHRSDCVFHESRLHMS